jgi:hypothetical protein
MKMKRFLDAADSQDSMDQEDMAGAQRSCVKKR